MKHSTKQLQYFVDKICTIFLTGTLQREFTEQQFAEYFIGQVESISDEGTITVNLRTNCKNYYAISNIAAISEEQALDPDNPEDAEVIQEIMARIEKTQNPVESETNIMDNNPYADIDLMASLARQAAELEKK